MPENPTKTPRGLLDTPSWGVVLVVLGLAAFGVAAVLSLEAKLGLRIAKPVGLALVWAAICVGMFSSYVVGHGLGREPVARGNGNAFGLARLVVGAIFMMTGLWYFWRYLEDGKESHLSLLWVLPNGFYFLLWGLGRPHLLEDGVWTSWTLYRWRRIESFAWSVSDPRVLFLNLKRTVESTITFTVPDDRREAVVGLLAAHGVRREGAAAASLATGAEPDST